MFDDLLSPPILAVIIFAVTYLFVVTGWKEQSIIAITGALAMWLLGLVKSDEIAQFVDFNVIFLLFGMMVVVGGLKESGFFRWIGIHLANLCHCKPARMLMVFSLATAVLSAFLDNVTTIIFMVAVTIEITRILRISATPFIVSEMFAANIGGTATLIGDPPNIIIGATGGLSFLDFIYNTAPPAALVLPVIVYLSYRRSGIAKDEGPGYTAIPVEPSQAIIDPKLFRVGLIIFSVTLIFFFVHELLNVRPATIALLAGASFLLLGGHKMPKVLKDIDWNTLIFLAGLFVLVGGLKTTGIIQGASTTMAQIVGSNELLATTVIVWFSAFSSASVTAIGHTTAFAPLVMDLSLSSGIDARQLLWALSLGAGFGANGSIIGSTANIAALGIAASEGILIRFKDFLKMGIPALVISISVANMYLALRLTLGW